jgi:hypothetical protein
MFGIALRYGVTLEELKAANPDVNPNFLSVGAVLVIPQSRTPQPSAEPVASTPAPVELSPVHCTPEQDGGAWCFLQAYNPQNTALESVSAMVRLTDEKAQKILTRPAYLLLDRLPAGESLPLQVYFPPEDTAQLSRPLLAGADLLTALPGAEDGRYLPLKLDKQVVKISEDGLSASAGLEVSLGLENSKAARLWVLAVAYDAQGNVIGARRWENGSADSSVSGGPLVSGETQSVSFSVYSIAGPIDHVAIFAEARP